MRNIIIPDLTFGAILTKTAVGVVVESQKLNAYQEPIVYGLIGTDFVFLKNGEGKTSNANNLLPEGNLYSKAKKLYTDKKYEEAFHVFTGKINNWKQINPSSNFNDMKIVFDGPKSSTVRYILDLTKQTKLPANFYAEKNSKKVVEYVANNKNAIGIVALCWLTDMTYDQKDTLYRQINLVNIKNRAAKDNMYYPPYQGNLVDSTYPFRRNIYLLSREAKTGLASGFASYLTSDKGQKVMLKSGLAPNEIPARHMEINMPKSK